MTAHPTASDRTAAMRLNCGGAIATVLVGVLATFGVLMSSAVAATVAAGLLQWDHGVAHALDNTIPLVVLFLGMLLSGRVAVDVAGQRAITSVVGAAVIVAALGMTVSSTSDAHGDAIEPWQVAVATLVVLVVLGSSSSLVSRHRTHRPL